MSQRVHTFRDAGVHSAPLRALNRVGEQVARLGFRPPSLEPESLIAAARRKTGLSDFGEDTYREPLGLLCNSAENEARLTTFGRIALRGILTGNLEARLKLVDWAKRHPEVRDEKITRPWVILGLPRTGTSLLSILLGLDPASRPLLQWEASNPVPPPDLATFAEDPRIAETARIMDQLHGINPPIKAMHPMGATLATECVALFAYDFRALLFETQAYMPSYGRWLERADMDSAYAMHRLALQVLQSRYPTQTWALKTPNHLWCIETLRKYYPDARLVWTHRDPHKVVPSVISLNVSLQRMNSDHVDPTAIGADWDHKLHHGVSCGMQFDKSAESPDWCTHVQYHEFIADPIAGVRRLYAEHDEELHPLHVARMEAWMRDRSQSAFGRHGYRAEDFGLSDEGIGERYQEYVERYDVPPEVRT